MSETDIGVKISIRCQDCEEITNPVETVILARNLPPCPNCESAHFGFDVDHNTEVTGEGDIQELIEVAKAVSKSGATPAQTLDFLMVEMAEVDTDVWAEARDVNSNSIKRRIDTAHEQLEEEL